MKTLFCFLLALCLPLPGQVSARAGAAGVSPATLQRIEVLANQGLERLSPRFPGTPTRRIRIFAHPDAKSIQPELRQALHEGVPGFALLGRSEIHLVLRDIGSEPGKDLRSTVEHELVHVLLDQYAGQSGRFVPRWFHEGLAQDLAESLLLGVHEEDLIYRAQTRSYIRFKDLEEDFPRDKTRLALAYGQSASFVGFLHRKIGLDVMLAAARDCGPEVSFRAALAKRLGRGLVAYEDEWLQYLIHDSGAGYRALLQNCFLLLLLALVVPLLTLAVARRRNREHWMHRRLAASDAADAEVAESEPEDEDEVDWDDWRWVDEEEGDPEEESDDAPHRW